MTPRVTIIDYGMGNLFSVWRAFEHCGAEVVLTSEPDKIVAADYLVLPGVGAFADGMAELRERGLIESIREYAATGKPFMGICLGMQMMMQRSEEFGTFEGLGLIEGSVVLFDAVDENGGRLKLPHIGWSELQPAGESPAWDKTILKNIVPGTPTYFVHSYTAQPVHPENILAVARYGVHDVTAAVVRGNLYGTQFHPERSGPAGLEIIKGFLDCGRPVTMENGQQL